MGHPRCAIPAPPGRRPRISTLALASQSVVCSPLASHPDGAQGNWKLLLDQWVKERCFHERGTPFTTI
eukprot:4773753-Prymnesium_polylepis.1